MDYKRYIELNRIRIDMKQGLEQLEQLTYLLLLFYLFFFFLLLLIIWEKINI